MESWDLNTFAEESDIRGPRKAMPRIQIEHKDHSLVRAVEERRDIPGSDGVKAFLKRESSDGVATHIGSRTASIFWSHINPGVVRSPSRLRKDNVSCHGRYGGGDRPPVGQGPIRNVSSGDPQGRGEPRCQRARRCRWISQAGMVELRSDSEPRGGGAHTGEGEFEPGKQFSIRKRVTVIESYSLQRRGPGEDQGLQPPHCPVPVRQRCETPLQGVCAGRQCCGPAAYTT